MFYCPKTGIGYGDGGNANINGSHNPQWDLVAPWTTEPQQPAPEIDWSKVPEGYDWVAMDADKSWWTYTRKPDRDGRGWFAKGKAARLFNFGSHPDWTQSLVQRPVPEPAPYWSCAEHVPGPVCWIETGMGNNSLVLHVADKGIAVAAGEHGWRLL